MIYSTMMLSMIHLNPNVKPAGPAWCASACAWMRMQHKIFPSVSDPSISISQAAGPIANLSLQPQKSLSLSFLKSEMTTKEIDGMMSHQYRRMYNVLHLQALRMSTFSDGIFCFLETPILTESEKTFVKFLPGQQINSNSNIYWKFFVSSNDLNMRAVPRDWRVLSRHSSGISSDMILQPFVSEILKSLYQHEEGFNQFHINHISRESCSFSIFSMLQGHFQSGARITLLKIIAEVVVKGEFKLEFLATVDVGINDVFL